MFRNHTSMLSSLVIRHVTKMTSTIVPRTTMTIHPKLSSMRSIIPTTSSIRPCIMTNHLSTVSSSSSNHKNTNLSVVDDVTSKPYDGTTTVPTSSSSMKYYHTTTSDQQADVTAANVGTYENDTTTTTTTASTSTFLNRWIVTGEVAISKIFPGGFGWQSGSLIAANYYQYTSDSLNFAFCTGIGDALGVFGGHCLYYYTKKSVLSSSMIDMQKEIHTGLWLGCAAFCSGTVWQPIVTTLQLADCSFTQVMLGTWLTCSTAFYIGLRIGRTILPLSTLAQPTYDNSQTDIALSVSIGGATGFFVGTDTAYLPEQNFLLPIVGITDTTTDLMGCTLAGTSTALGFVTSQSVLNTIYPKEKCWND